MVTSGHDAVEQTRSKKVLERLATSDKGTIVVESQPEYRPQGAAAITLYWLTNTAISSARLYWENKVGLYNAANISVPAAVSLFPGENYEAPRSWAERAYHKLIYFNTLDKGGHYAAWEQPQLFSEEVRAGLRSLRS